MSFIPCTDKKDYNFTDYELIVPSVSIGNVGQLSIDVLLETTRYVDKGMRIVGYFDSNALYPIAARSTLDKQLLTSAQVYASDDKRVAILHIRSPLLKGYRDLFIGQLSTWITSSKFSGVKILASISTHDRVDVQISGSQLRYVTSAASSAFDLHTRWLPLESGPDPDVDIHAPGSGFGRFLYTTLLKSEPELKIMLLMKFCSEGDNRSDAIELISACNDVFNWCPAQEAKWRTPYSWELLFGVAPDITIY